MISLAEMNGDDMLSPLQKSCLRWLFEGRSIKVIARLEAKTVGEIELCVVNAMASLGAETIDDALRKAGISGSDR